MNTFPILAAADPVPLPAPGSASHGASGDNTDFSHVLRQLDSGATADATSDAAANPPKLCSFSNSSADAAPAQDKSAIPRRISAPPGIPGAASNAALATEGVVRSDGVASHGAKNAEHDPADGAAGAAARQVTSAGNSILLHAKDKIKEAAAKEPASGEKARSSTVAAAAVVPAAAVLTPDKASLLTATLASAGAAVTSQQACGAESAKAPLDQPPGFPGEAERSPRNAQGYAAESALPGTDFPTARASAVAAQGAAGSPADPSASADDSSLGADGATVSANSASALAGEIRASTSFGASQPTLPTMRAESAPRAPSSTIAAAAGAKSKAQAANSSDKAGGADVSAGGNEAASALQISTRAADFRASLAREDFMQGGSPVDHSTFRSGADSASRQPKIRSRSQMVSQGDSSSATQENSVGVERDANAGLAAEGGQHTPSFQPASLSPVGAPTPAAFDAAQSGAQSIAHSAAVVLPQPSGDTAEAAAQAQPKLPSNPLPDPHRMVDFGQLRTGENNSELKVSVQLPELGKIEVRAVTSHDVTTAHLTASHHDALQVLSADRSGLEEALKSRDVILGSLDSHTQRHSGGQQRQENAPSSAPSSGGTSPTAARATSLAIEDAARAAFLPDYSSISVRA
jgi:hypothetical protein